MLASRCQPAPWAPRTPRFALRRPDGDPRRCKSQPQAAPARRRRPAARGAGAAAAGSAPSGPEAITPEDVAFMERALELARRGEGHTAPNPAVGCVLVDPASGQVVGEGYHPRAGMPHAEVYALRAAGQAAKGATAYVTLEPCNHHGRTPPCSRALVAAGVGRVVVAVVDPNPLVGGQGVATLRKAGIPVAVGCAEAAAAELNADFMQRMRAEAAAAQQAAGAGAA